MTRVALFGIVICVAATAVVASASSLGGIGSSRLGSGDTTIAHCDTAVTPTYTTSGGNVTAITVAGISDPSCEGAVISVVVVDGAGTSIAAGGPQTIVADGDALDNTVAIAVSPNPAAESAAAIHVSVVGP